MAGQVEEEGEMREIQGTSVHDKLIDHSLVGHDLMEQSLNLTGHSWVGHDWRGHSLNLAKVCRSLKPGELRSENAEGFHRPSRP